MIYLDNAATTLRKPQIVIDAVVQAMNTAGNASRGAHDSSLSASRIVYDAREKLADFFGCKRADHVVFTANSTEALNIAINGTLSQGDHVITTDLEHNSVLRPLYRLEDEGVITLSVVKADEKGCVDYEDFSDLLRENTKAVVCTHASNLTGNVLDLKRIKDIITEKSVGRGEIPLLIADVSQTAGELPIHMEKMGIDILCFTGHKGLMGPQGTGGLCIKEGVFVRPWKTGGSGTESYNRHQPEEMPVRLEAGTLNIHGIAGLSAALDFIRETGLDRITEKEQLLSRHFYEEVRNIDGVTVYGDFSQKERCSIVTINIHDWDSAVTADELAEHYGIAVRAGAHCAPRMHQALGTADRGAVRFSFSWFNTMEEADDAIAAIRELAE